MTVEKVYGQISSDRIAGSKPVSKKKAELPEKAEIGSDRANISVLSRLLAKNARELASIHEVRPEKVKHFMKNIDEPEFIPDSAIDTIMSKLTDF